MELSVGKDLSGWRIEIWYELRLSTDDTGGYRVDGYFSDQHVAMHQGRRRGWYGCDGEVGKVFVLTHDGKEGYLISNALIERQVEDESVLRQRAVEDLKKNLTPELKQFLNLE